MNDSQEVIETDTEMPEDHREAVLLMEPLTIAEGYRHRAVLVDLAVDLVLKRVLSGARAYNVGTNADTTGILMR